MLRSESALTNETRKLIYNHIMAHPGVSFLVLKSVLKLNDSTLRYHLNYLERSEKISFGLEEGRRYYYPHLGASHVIHQSEDSNTLMSYELTGVQEKIISTIKSYPKINQKELAKITRINRMTLSRNINMIKDLFKVAIEFEKDTVIFYEMIQAMIEDDETSKDLEKIIEEERRHIELFQEFLRP